MTTVRIQKLLSDAGVASRRMVEQMILDGRITVNGQLVASLPCFVDPATDEILVDNLPVTKKPQKLTYLLVNKPRGVVSTEHDPQGRPSVLDAGGGQRLVCVAPLDVDSTGLVLLTNDGEMVRSLTHASSQLQRRYVAEVDGQLSPEQVESLKEGVYLDGRRTRGATVKVISRSRERTMLEVDIIETRNRELRRLFARIGHKVRRLKRLGLGPLTDRGLKIGHVRPLMPHEIRQLQAIAGADHYPSRSREAGTRQGERNVRSRDVRSDAVRRSRPQAKRGGRGRRNHHHGRGKGPRS